VRSQSHLVCPQYLLDHLFVVAYVLARVLPRCHLLRLLTVLGLGLVFRVRVRVYPSFALLAFSFALLAFSFALLAFCLCEIFSGEREGGAHEGLHLLR